MNLHQEHHFEREIRAHLAANGWLYSEAVGAEGDAALFDRANGLFMPDLLAWVEATQPDSWQHLNKTHSRRGSAPGAGRARAQEPEPARPGQAGCAAAWRGDAGG
ncbi:MAG TPA: hypothetical protein VJN44_16885 [Roseateles sp.]|nr:hypothetical protein [Roseateles sp.]